ncbi:PE domain-containing protein [Nocardia sp. NEAU-G5]|uniref:PE domain-containing protein n=1 Tax=Nocardia albiluteola TaxID=2842303 RepID=A0ABS6B4G3_9NOCA|nr:PE domain-containing protein [Nocardia albiluteola]MBU3065197.1 PE domain-containing protein [Nocardia albiluteola]
MSKFAFDHDLARHAAGRLDTLADLLEGDLHHSQAALGPAAPAHDPVSLQVALTLDQVGDSFRQAYRSGVHELRKIAANMRAHSDSFADSEDQSADAFRGQR